MVLRSPFSYKVLRAVVLLTAVLSMATAVSHSVSAAPVTGFNAGRIIEDDIFYNKNAMTAGEIQKFLDNLIPNCDTWGVQRSGYGNLTNAQYAQQIKGWHGPPYVCINNYHENPDTHETSFEKGGGYFAGGISAAQIIYNAAQQYNINPQVLLVMLKKESAGPLTADSWPIKSQYNYAMGYACPDSGPNNSANCSNVYAGLYNQVNRAAWQLNYYKQNPNNYRYRIGLNNIQYSTVASCGTKQVNIENIATLSLYIYTPYTPNDGALAAYPGTANCGAYGNRNFYQFFKEWFGFEPPSQSGIVANLGSNTTNLSSFSAPDGLRHVFALKANGDVTAAWWGNQNGKYVNQSGIVANFGSGATNLSSFVTPDGLRHVFALKANGDVAAAWWGNQNGKYVNQSGIVANFGSGATNLSSFVTPDGLRHVFALKANGDVAAAWWGTENGRYINQTGIVANLGTGITNLSSLVTPDGLRHVFALKTNGDVMATWWGNQNGNYVNQSGMVANLGTGATNLNAFVSPDGLRHLFALKANGNVSVAWWGTQDGRYISQSGVAASFGGGVTDISSFVTNDGLRHVLALKTNGDVSATWQKRY